MSGLSIILALVAGTGWLFFPTHPQFLAYAGVLVFMSIAGASYPFFYHRNQAEAGALLLCVALFLVITATVFTIPAVIPAGGIAYFALIIVGKLLLDKKNSLD